MPTPQPPSLIWNDGVDPPVVIDADYQFDKNDRQYIDSQIRGLETKAVSGNVDNASGGVVKVGGTASAIDIASPLGGSAAPLVLQVTPALSAATSFSLSAAQQATPILQLTGTVGSGGTTITLPNTVGSVWIVDLSAVTLTGGLTFSTGSGTTATVSSTDLGSHKRLVTVAVSASNVVSWG